MPKDSEPKQRAANSFRLPPDLIKKLKYIAVVDETTQTDIVRELLTDYVTRWEKKNGEIRAKK